MIINNKLIFIAIPRTGTHSVEQCLIDNKIPYYNIAQRSSYDTEFYKKVYKAFNEKFKLVGTDKQRSPAAISTRYLHTHAPARFWDSTSHKFLPYFTILREPVARFISVWNHVLVNNTYLGLDMHTWKDKEVVEYIKNSIWFNKGNFENHYDYINTLRKSKNLNPLEEQEMYELFISTSFFPQSYFYNSSTPIKKFKLENTEELLTWFSEKLKRNDLPSKLTRENTGKNEGALVRTSFLEDFIYNEYEKKYTNLF